MNDIFQDIRPYEGREVIEAAERLGNNSDYTRAIRNVLPEKVAKRILGNVGNITSCADFQREVTYRFMEAYAQQTITCLTISGFEKLNPNDFYLFVANHRDIILDSALLQMEMYKHNFRMLKSGIGDNLASTPMFMDVARTNNMFLIKRKGSKRELLESSILLSKYIRYNIVEKHDSVWIAQRNGRTKDGEDKTQQGVLKMFEKSSTSADIIDGFRELNIVPVVISYEYEPCDTFKARELCLTERDGVYVKAKDEDFNSMRAGILQKKGNVHISICNPLNMSLDKVKRGANNNETLTNIAQLIDNEIYQGYRLWRTNYIAADLMRNEERYTHQYTDGQFYDFQNYLREKSCSADAEFEPMYEHMLRIYATPVIKKEQILAGKDE